MSRQRVGLPTVVLFRRLAAVIFSLIASFAAAELFVRYADADGMSAVDMLRCGLIAISTAWLAWGAALSLLGLFYVPDPIVSLNADQKLRGRSAILVPVYNEDPVSTFSRVAAMDEALSQLGVTDLFDFAILSDTTSEAIAADEALWWGKLVADRRGEDRIFYRRRSVNTGKKAGNIEDFIRRSGAAYDYALILDADSLMDGRTILEMARRMEADPDLGLLQTLPEIIYAQSFFGRAMQFSASYFSPVFARGVAMLQGYEGPFWGHNAFVRVRAFAESCGLPQLSGRPPFGGHIMSHDYVEAALLARGGWKVRLDPDLTASYEESPENLLEHAKRDRRWCQGNLQHAKLLLAPNLKLWSRFIFAQGIMAYVASPIWLLFLLSSIASPFFAPRPDYFPRAALPLPDLSGRRDDDGAGAGQRHLVPAGAAQAGDRAARHHHRRQCRLRRHAAGVHLDAGRGTVLQSHRAADAVVPEPGGAAGAARRRWRLVGGQPWRRPHVARRCLARLALDRALGRGDAGVCADRGAGHGDLADPDRRTHGDRAAGHLGDVAECRRAGVAAGLHDPHRNGAGGGDDGARPHPR